MIRVNFKMYANGYKYWLAYKKGNSGYYRCCRYKVKCPGRCVVDEDGVVRSSTSHNHPPEADRVSVDRFRKVLTHRAASEATDLHVIYLEEATNRHADASLLYTFSLAESCMRKARRKMQPHPSMMELTRMLANSDRFQIHWDRFYQTTVRTEDSISLVLWHKRTLDAIGKIDELYLDCSLQVSGEESAKYHVLVGLTIYRNSCIPLVYCVMTERSYSAFLAIFAYVREQMGAQFLPATIFTEPNRIVKNALAISFPEATIKVYWHHYTTSVLVRTWQLGLGREIIKGHLSSALRMLLVLPMLPDNYMNTGLEALKEWMQEKGEPTENFIMLCNFVRDSWLNSVGARQLSIFNQPQSTSNLPQTFLRDLQSRTGIQRCTILHMLETLSELATKIFDKLSKTIKRAASDQPEKTKSKRQQLQETVINQATQQWNRNPGNSLQFLQLCSHCINDAMFSKSLHDGKNYGQPFYNDISLNVPTVAQNCFQDLPKLTNVTPPPMEPPPLTFFPKNKPVEPNRITSYCYSQTEPPPLIPFTNSNIEQSSARVEKPS